MNIRDYEFNKQIETVGDLQLYIGMPIMFYYDTFDSGTYSWIKEVSRIGKWGEKLSSQQPITYINVGGYNSLEVNSMKFKNDDSSKPKYSNAQIYARTLTKEELKNYLKKSIARRMLVVRDKFW